MKKFSFIIFSTLIAFAACKQGTNSSQTKTTTDSTTNTGLGGLKMPDVGSIKTNTANNFSGSWSVDFRKKFVSDCITKASENISASQAFGYCDCMADKIEKKYPDEKLVNSQVSNADVESMRPDCLSAVSLQAPANNNSNNNNSNNYNSAKWSSSEQSEFMNTCVSESSSSLGKDRASNYCQCMMDKIMMEYPNAKDAGNMPKDHMTSLATDCLKR